MDNSLRHTNRKRRTMTRPTVDIILLSLIVVLACSTCYWWNTSKMLQSRNDICFDRIMELNVELLNLEYERDYLKKSCPPEIAADAVKMFEQNKITGGR